VSAAAGDCRHARPPELLLPLLETAHSPETA
jgi:hypothetical protein